MTNKPDEERGVKIPRRPDNEKLRAIAQAFSDDVPQLISEAEDQILASWSAAEQEAQDNDTKPKFKLGFAVVLDLDADAMLTKLSFATTHTKSISRQIPDPSQPDLPELDDDGSPHESVMGSELKKLAKQIKKRGAE